MTGKSKTARPRSESRGTPAQVKPYSWIWDRVNDGRIWEIHPNDHHIKPRRFYLETRNYFSRLHVSAMIVKRDRMIYVQVLDDGTKKDDTTVYALNNRMPYVQRWLLPSEVTPKSEPDPGEEDDEIEDEDMKPRPRRRTGNYGRGPSKRYVPAKEAEPFVLAVMNRYFEHSLTVMEITRVADTLLRESGTELRFAHHQQIRQCLNALVDEENTPIFKRTATDRESKIMGFPPGRTNLYSPTEPVPEWSPRLHLELLETYPEPRVAPDAAERIRPPVSVPIPVAAAAIPPAFKRPETPAPRVLVEQPGYTVTTHRGPLPMTVPEPARPRPPQTQINGTLIERATAITRELSQLVVDLETQKRTVDQGLANEVTHLREDNQRLVDDNGRLQKERDDAVSQLQAIANAQNAMAEILKGLK